ncbi:MAG: ATP-binding protein [Wenzhouxiangellaceae bacterium]|nr:ATP-binding protein [Wenzhouxiangellaceae bacterium]
MAIPRLIRRTARALPMAAVAGMLLVALLLVAGVERESAQLGRLTLVIFTVTGVALLVLVGAIARRLARLLRQVRSREPGARLRARLVAIFVALALPPVVILYLFSVEFLSETIEGWLDTGTEPALSDSLALGQLYLESRTRQARSRTEVIADRVALAGDEDERLDALFSAVSNSGPSELTVLDESGRVESLVHIDPSRMVADLPSAFALSQAARGQDYAAAEPAGDGLQIRVLVPLPGPAGAGDRVLQGIFPLPPSFSDLAASIERAYFRHENVSFLRDRLQQSFVLILSLVLAMTALLAMLLAFNAAARLVRPIRELAEATEIMRAGEFPEALEVTSRDELGFLVESFNRMATELHRTQRQLESQRSYLETVLGRLSAGVLAFDEALRLETANASASEILGVDLEACRGASLDELEREHPSLSALFEVVRTRAGRPGDAWRQEIRIERSDRTLALVCRGSTLPGQGPGSSRGHVVAFDDVTLLDQAQREAAWAELARRLAHEVKNPLTPIRLAAERLQIRLGNELPAPQDQLVQRTTDTIIHQVDHLRRLVDAFGDYARPGPDRTEPVELAEVVDPVVGLWTSGDSGVRFRVDLAHGNLRVLADPGRLHQILNNLVQNAREAHPDGAPTLAISSRPEPGDAPRHVRLEVRDDGPGIPADILPRIFEPYVTTKERGTGLGLAIVHRLVDEMGGRISVDNAPAGGARVRLDLPVAPR